MTDDIGAPYNLRLIHSGEVDPNEGAIDPINPPHYQREGVETIDIIEHVIKDYPPVVAYHIGSALKYLARAPHKHASPLADLNKAKWFLDRAIQAYSDGNKNPL